MMMIESIDRWMTAMVSDEGSGGEGPDVSMEAVVISKERGMICGTFVVERLLETHYSSCSVEWRVSEGSIVDIGDEVLRIFGNGTEMLRSERVLLNVLGRLSGISTNSSRWINEAGSMGVASTRKVDWGLLDKWAVHVGGGLTHRLNREDALMIKDSEVLSSRVDNETEDEALTRLVLEIDMDTNSVFTVIEVRSVEQALTVTHIWKEVQTERAGSERVVILLDNMGPELSSMVSRRLEEEGLREWCVLEGSGGISLEEVKIWSKCGVDLISTSSINRGVLPLDLSMKFRGE
tara:strand:- start:3205 stop:4080 length:876 start_codon:yes stop_codon:yes gene_type:complete